MNPEDIFDNDEWNAERQELERAVITAAQNLLDHSGASRIQFPLGGGLVLTITEGPNNGTAH